MCVVFFMFLESEWLQIVTFVEELGDDLLLTFDIPKVLSSVLLENFKDKIHI